MLLRWNYLKRISGGISKVTQYALIKSLTTSRKIIPPVSHRGPSMGACSSILCHCSAVCFIIIHPEMIKQGSNHKTNPTYKSMPQETAQNTSLSWRCCPRGWWKKNLTLSWRQRTVQQFNSTIAQKGNNVVQYYRSRMQLNNCPERLWMLPRRRCSRPGCMGLWATWSSRRCPCQEVATTWF